MSDKCEISASGDIIESVDAPMPTQDSADKLSENCEKGSSGAYTEKPVSVRETAEGKLEENSSDNKIVSEKASGSKIVNEEKPMEVESGKDTNIKNEGGNERHAPKRRLSVITISDTSDSDDSSVCHIDSYQASTSEAKKIRGDYSSSDSYTASSEDDSEPENDNETSVITLPPSTLSKCLSSLKTRAPRLSAAKLNPCFLSDDVNEKFLGHWTNKQNFKTENITLHCDPFRVCVLDNFLENEEIVNNIIDDMTTLDWSRSKMDLYEFHRSTDLANLSWQRAIKSFYELLNDVIMKWVAQITNLKLTHISASCALYGPGDHLLVHDDLMSDRKVAFIFYMAPWDIQAAKEPETNDSAQNDSKDIGESTEAVIEEKRPERGWSPAMGGELNFLTTDSKGMPTVPVKSLLPCNNTFAFFKVGSNTFHQVSEVLSFDFPRLTINGWFHGPCEEGEEPATHVEEQTPVPYTDLAEKPHTDMFQTSLNEWITSTYLSPRTKFKIQQHIEQSSEISLEDFFMKNQYDIVVNSLQDKNLSWQSAGPAHMRHHDLLTMEAAGEDVKQLCQLFSSNHFLRLLGDFTELRLKSYHSLQVQRWTAASYAVLPPKSHYSVTELDVILYLGLPSKQICGGCTMYLAPEERDSETLITVAMANNALNLVYSDTGTSKFTKYVSKLSLASDEYFYIISCSYRE